MFKAVYKIERWEGIKTPFHKKYWVFDGLGSKFFDTIIEARIYVSERSNMLKQIYLSSKSIYKKLTEYYFDKLIKFRISDTDNNIINSLLINCLESYKLLSRVIFPQYALSKLKHIYNCFLKIARLLKNRILERTVFSVYESFFTPYPVYKSSDYQYTNTIKLFTNEKKKCVI